MRYYLKKIRSSIFFIIISISFFGCSDNPTKPKTGSISGKVLLNGQTDNSGILVEVYPLESVDPELSGIISSYPNVGVPLSQAWLFDHRNGIKIATIATDQIGSFHISDIEVGVYNIVMHKDGWGWRYKHQIQVPENQNVTFNPDTLFPEVNISGGILTTQTWLSGHHYVINTNTVLQAGNTLIIQPGCWIRFNGLTKLTVNGKIDGSGSINQPIIFTSNSSNPTPGDWDRVEFSSADTTSNIKFWSMQFGYNPLKIISSNVKIESVYLNKTADNALTVDGSKPVLSNFLIFKNNRYGINIINFSGGIIKNSVITSNQLIGIDENRSSTEISNNYISGQGKNLVVTQAAPVIQHNLFMNANFSLSLVGATPTILYNVFQRTNQWALDFVGLPQPLVRFNNFDLSGSYTINILAEPYGSGFTIVATNNYWGTINQATIQNRIVDENDPLPLNYHRGFVDHSSIELNEISTAGIQP